MGNLVYPDPEQDGFLLPSLQLTYKSHLKMMVSNGNLLFKEVPYFQVLLLLVVGRVGPHIPHQVSVGFYQPLPFFQLGVVGKKSPEISLSWMFVCLGKPFLFSI